MMKRSSRIFLVLSVLFLVFALSNSTVFAQAWGTGMYQSGMSQMLWGGQLPMVTIRGNAIVDSAAFSGLRDSTRSRYLYFIDTAGNGVRTYQLFFGPYWYDPASGATRPQNGEALVVRGGLYSGVVPPLLAVYSLNGQIWRDTTGAPPWGGQWVHRAAIDTTRVYCINDSAASILFPPGAMGMGMMRGGTMHWPDSMFVDFEQMLPDSLPFMARATAFAGFHLDLFDTSGAMMIPGSTSGGFGVISMERPIQIRVRISPDTLRARGRTMLETRLMFLDADSTWQEVLNQTRDTTTNTIIANPPNVREYYAVTTGATTGIENLGGPIPTQFTLEQNYPNPFNPTTGIRFQVPALSGVEGPGVGIKLSVYDLLGREVAVLANERKAPGTYGVSFDGSRLASGVYIYRLTAGSFVQSRKMTLLK